MRTITEYINRRDVQNILSKYYPDAGPTTEQILHNINLDVKNVPDADVVEVVHGEWIDHVNPRNDDDWACSNCGSYFVFEAGDPIANGTNYCPHCGARMDGGDHNAAD